MPRGSFNTPDDLNPLLRIEQAVGAFIGRFGPLQQAHLEENSKGLFIATEHNDGKQRLLLHSIDGESNTGNLPDSEGGLDSPTFLSMEDFLATDFGARVPIVEKLVHEAETVVIGGRPKVGKSRVVHQLALALVQGEPFLGMTVPKRRRVLLWDLENGKSGVQDRFRRMLIGSGEGLFIAVSDTLADSRLTNSEEGLQFLGDRLNATNADVLIIDPWRLWLGGDENNGEHVVRGLKALSSLRSEHPALTIIIVHHVRKENTESPKKLLQDPRLWSDNLSGHHALISHAHAAFGLERRTEDEEEMIVFGGVARNTEPKTLILVEDEVTLRFDVCRNEQAAAQVMTKKERELWAKAKQLGEFRFGELERATGTKNKKAITSMLKKTQEHGVVVKIGGKYLVQEGD